MRYLIENIFNMYSIRSDEPSSVYTTVFVFVLCGLLVYLIRLLVLSWRHGIIRIGHSESVTSCIPKIKMDVVKVPFTFKLLEDPVIEFRVIGCKISSEVSYSMFVYWGIHISELGRLLASSSYEFTERCRTGKLFDAQSYIDAGMQHRTIAHKEKVIRINYPRVPLNLGPSPRYSYPLLVCLVMDEGQIREPNEIHALISVVHVKDSELKNPTNILVQYLKQYSGNLCTLQQLYTSYSNPETVGESSDMLCIICQQYIVSRVLLPCRHTCVCEFCFQRLENCPMCRSPITSYFCIHNEYSNQQTQVAQGTLAN